MSYRLAARAFGGLGDNIPYSGPANDDPRMVRQYGTIKVRYTPRNVTSTQSPSVPGMLTAAARSLFPQDNVKDAGWFPGGVVGYTVVLSSERRLGEVRRLMGNVALQVGPRIGPTTELYNGRVSWDWNDIKPASGGPAPADTDTTAAAQPASAPATDEEGFFAKKVGGVPVWALGTVGVVVLGGIGFAVLRKPRAAALSANRRRHRR